MKNAVITLCVCLALIVLPCAAQAEEPSWGERAGGILSLGMVGAGVGLLVGAAAVGLSGGSSASGVLAGGAIGFVLGAFLAIMYPATGEMVQEKPQAGAPPSPATPAEAH